MKHKPFSRNKKLVSRVKTVTSLYEFKKILLKSEKRLLMVLFLISGCDKKLVYFINDLSQRGNMHHIDFALVETDLHPDIGKAAALDSSLPEFRIYKGKEILASYKNYGPHIIEDIHRLARHSFKGPACQMYGGKLLQLSRFLLLLTFGLFGVGLVLTITPKITFPKPMLQILPKSSLSCRVVKLENGSLYVPTKSAFEKINDVQIDERKKYCETGSGYETPSICSPLPLLPQTLTVRRLYTPDDSWRRDVLESTNKANIIASMVGFNSQKRS
jgi:hypothetical protein